MNVYFFDENTKEFIAEAKARKDPRASERLGKDVWLLPANATFDAPLQAKDGYKVVYKDGWQYEKLPEPKKEPEPTLDELKDQKRSEINADRDRSEHGGFEYLDKTFDSDPVSCQRISCAAQAMQYAADDATITWTTKDNSTIDLNKNQLSGLVVALAQWSNTCHQKATALKAKIDAAQTAEELEKISWDETPLIL